MIMGLFRMSGGRSADRPEAEASRSTPGISNRVRLGIVHGGLNGYHPMRGLVESGSSAVGVSATGGGEAGGGDEGSSSC